MKLENIVECEKKWEECSDDFDIEIRRIMVNSQCKPSKVFPIYHNTNFLVL